MPEAPRPPTIRLATPADAGSIAEVHVRSWQSAYRGVLPDDLLDSLSVDARERFWAGPWWDTRGGRLYVAEVAARIVAFAAIGPSRDADAGPSTGELYAIYADPDVWGRGVGRLLMDASVAALRDAGFSEATLWVLVGNERGRHFYDAAGWRPDGARRVDELRPGVNAEEIRYRIGLGRTSPD